MRLHRITLLLILSFIPMMGYVNVLASQPSEYLLKAVFLEKFTRFIDWPSDTALDDTTEPFVIGVLGKNPFDVDLSKIYLNQKIKNKQVKILHALDINEIDDCHLLFICKSETNRISGILKQLQNQPVLTVCDSEKMSGKGCMINMVISGKHIRFEIDETAIHKAGFQASYLLLQEAKIINPYKSIE